MIASDGAAGQPQKFNAAERAAALRERIARVKRAQPLLATVLTEGVALRPAGRGRWEGRCPFHDDRTPSFSVYAGDDRFRCFGGGCGVRGDIFDWYRLRRGLDFAAALAYLDAAPPPPARPARADGGDRSPLASATRDPLWERLGYEEQAVMNRAGAHYQRLLRATPAARAYLMARGIPRATVEARCLGYSDGRGLYEALGTARRRAVAVGLGLLTVPGRYRPLVGVAHAGIPRGAWRETLAGRLLIPELRQGQPIWFAGRRRGDDADPGSPPTGRRAPKYRNLRGARPILGYELVAGRREAYLAEGPFDWLTAVSWGLAACCTCGTGYRLDRLGFLAAAETVFGLFDGDAAGRRAIWRFAAVLGPVLRPLDLPDGLDLNALGRHPDGRARFAALLAAGRRGRFLRSPPASCAEGT